MTVHTYTVRRGESVRSISDKFSVPQDALLRENPTPFYEGQRLSIPVDLLNLPPAKTDFAAYFQVAGDAVLHHADGVNVIFL